MLGPQDSAQPDAAGRTAISGRIVLTTLGPLCHSLLGMSRRRQAYAAWVRRVRYSFHDKTTYGIKLRFCNPRNSHK